MRKEIFKWFVPVILLCLMQGCNRDLVKSKSSADVIMFPSPPDSARIQFITSLSSSTDIVRPQSGFNKFLFGAGTPKDIVKPYGICAKGPKVYICDTGVGGLTIIDFESRSFKPFLPEGRGELKLPLNCAVDERNYLYVADGNRRQVVVFNENGIYQGVIGGSENFKPTDVKIMGDTLFVTSLPEHRITLFNKLSLGPIGSFPECVPGDNSYLYQPTNICLTKNEVFVSDMGDYKIKVFTHGGEYIRSVGSYGNKSGQLTRPKGVAVDSLGNLFVVDAAFENVQIFNPEGNLLMHFGGPYNRKGDLWLPAGISIDYSGIQYFENSVDKDFTLQYLIFVANQYGPDKIGIYGFVRPKNNK